MRGGRIKRGKSKLASNHFLMCIQSGLLRDVHGVIYGRGEGRSRQVARRIKEGNENERDRSSQ